MGIHEANEKMEEKWQEMWTNSTKSRWTHTFFPSIKERMATNIDIDHYNSQLMTNHGDLNRRLHQLQLTEDGRCACGMEEETADHIIRRYKLAEAHRENLIAEINKYTRWPCSNYDIIRNPASRKELSNFARNYLISKETKRQEQQVP